MNFFYDVDWDLFLIFPTVCVCWHGGEWEVAIAWAHFQVGVEW